MTPQHSAKAVPQIAVGQANSNSAFSKGSAPDCRSSKPIAAQRSAKSVLRMQAKNSRKEDKLLFEILGKEISVFYNDTANSVSFKEGKFTDFDSFSLMVIENSNSKPTLIPRGKCIRIEQSSTAPAQPAAKELPFAKQKPSQQIITGGAKIAAATR